MEASDEGVVAGRLISGIRTRLDGSAITVASGYRYSNLGLKGCSLSLVATVCRLAMQTRLETAGGGDFQSEPVSHKKLTCFAEAGLTIKSAERDNTTCTSKHGGPCLRVRAPRSMQYKHKKMPSRVLRAI